MTLRRFEYTSLLPVAPEEAYAWHLRPGAFERLLPPWDRSRVLEHQGNPGEGRMVLEIPVGPWHWRWVARHESAVPGREFTDEQVEGPFRSWRHHHRFEPVDSTHCRYIDLVEYELPFGTFGEVAAPYVHRRLERMFSYRHATLLGDLTLARRVPGHGPLTIAITGANGLIGSRLEPFLTTAGHRVRRIIRRPARPGDIGWDPEAGRLDPSALEGVDAVVHLAGAPIAGGRWTVEQRQRILESRLAGTTLLAATLARLARPPRVLVSASAIGIYGDRGDEVLTEEAPLRTGPDAMFVEQVGHAWEAGVEPADRAGIRSVRLRIGLVLTPAGGALGRMLLPFRLGLGGRLGDGRQYMSWIGIDDVLGAILHAIHTESMRGAVNATGLAPVTNAEFTRTLGQVLHRPAALPVPAGALRLLFGDMADELLLSSLRVVPERLQQSGYVHRHASLEPALRHVLGR
jgi:uncharacterized protein (TIGR01777 family)